MTKTNCNKCKSPLHYIWSEIAVILHIKKSCFIFIVANVSWGFYYCPLIRFIKYATTQLTLDTYVVFLVKNMSNYVYRIKWKFALGVVCLLSQTLFVFYYISETFLVCRKLVITCTYRCRRKFKEQWYVKNK